MNMMYQNSDEFVKGELDHIYNPSVNYFAEMMRELMGVFGREVHTIET
jgi:hypothetical protein